MAEAGFPWPPLPGGGEAPRWTGKGFEAGGRSLGVLAYHADESSWDSGLTDFHEQEAGGDHFIDLASRRAALEGLRRFGPREPRAVLEVGVSSGFLLPMLRRACPAALVIGADAFPQALQALAAKDPSWPLLQFDLCACPLPGACVDAVILLNVLEHIEQDVQALREVARILKPGGLAWIEVPAGPGLYDVYDQLLRHHRRYGMRELKAKAREAGLKVAWASHLGFFLYPAFAAVKRLNRWKDRKGGRDQQAVVAAQISGSRRQRLPEALMKMEFQLGRLLSYPFGIRCLMAARKPQGA